MRAGSGNHVEAGYEIGIFADGIEIGFEFNVLAIVRIQIKSVGQI